MARNDELKEMLIEHVEAVAEIFREMATSPDDVLSIGAFPDGSYQIWNSYWKPEQEVKINVRYRPDNPQS